MGLPLRFEENSGQAGGSAVRFAASALSYRADFLDREVQFRFPEGKTVRMQFPGSASATSLSAEEEIEARTNYLLGNDPTQWRTGIRNFNRVRYAGLWPGVDAVFYGNQGQIEYDLRIAPGADPSQVRLRFAGADRVSVSTSGDLIIEAGEHTLTQKAPVVFQGNGALRRNLRSRYVMHRPDEVSFAVEPHDASKTLVIDPIIEFSTFAGGAQVDWAYGLAVDSTGASYVTGRATSFNQGTAGAAVTSLLGSSDAFVMKVDPSGSRILYFTYLGGSADETGWSIAVDSLGQAHVAGQTGSTNFPRRIADTSDPWFPASPTAGPHGFVAKLNAAGNSFVYSGVVGGSTYDIAWQLALDGNGNAYITGETSSDDFPVRNAFQGATVGLGDAFLVKLNPQGGRVYSTLLSGQGNDAGYAVTVDNQGRAIVSGVTGSPSFPLGRPRVQNIFNGLDYGSVFVLRVSAAGLSVDYVLFLGGRVTGTSAFEPAYQEPFRLAADATGNVYVGGWTTARDFTPAPPPGAFQPQYGGGPWDGFLARLDGTSGQAVWTTYFGGTSGDNVMGLAVNSAGEPIISGRTNSANFPVRTGAVQRTYGGGRWDGFIARLNAAGTAVLDGTYLGGTGSDEILDMARGPGGSILVAGNTTSTDFPVSAGAARRTIPGSYSMFLTRINDGASCTTRVTSGAIGASPQGQSGTIGIQTQAGCGWFVSPESSLTSWIQFDRVSGSGPANVSYSIAANSSPSSRSGQIAVNGEIIRVVQGAASCDFRFEPSLVSMPAAGERRTVGVSVAPGLSCPWTAQSDSPWLRILSGSGTGSGQITMFADPNTGSARTAIVSAGNQLISVLQSVGGCEITLSSRTGLIEMNGGSGVIDVLASSPECPWTAQTSDSWIQLLDTAGTGAGQVRFRVSPSGTLFTSSSSGDFRTGSITAGGRVFRVVQLNAPSDARAGAAAARQGDPSSGLDFSVMATSPGRPLPEASDCVVTGITRADTNQPINTLTFEPDSQPITVNVQYSGSCDIAAAWDNQAFPVSPGSYSKRGGPAPFSISPPSTSTSVTVNLIVSFFTAKTRGFELKVARKGKACSIRPRNSGAEFPASPDGALGVVELEVDPTDCGWNGNANSNWIEFPSGNQGTGPGSLSFRVKANGATQQRAAAIRLNDAHEYKVVQKGVNPPPCTVSFNAGQLQLTAGQQTRSLQITANQDSCAWSITTSGGFLTAATPSGAGSRSVNIAVAANTSTSDRQGTVAIRSSTDSSDSDSVTFTQAGTVPPAVCTFAVSPASADFPAPGGSGSFSVTAGAGCTWTAVPQASWVTVTGPGGSGNGPVSFTVAANTGDSRSTTINIGDAAFTVNQAAAAVCAYSLTPTSANFAAGGGNGQFNVTAGAGCAWTAKASDSWIQVTSGSAGAGNGAVQFAVQPNTGAARGGNIAVGDASFVIKQSGSGGGGTITIGNTVLSQFVFGGGWYSALYFTNVSSATARFTVRFYDDSGRPMTVGSAPTRDVTIAPSGSAVIEASNTGSLSQGWATWDLAAGVSGYGVFRQSVPGRPDQEAVSPFAGSGANAASMIFDEVGLTTAIALAAPVNSTANVVVQAVDERGGTIGGAIITLAAGSKTSFVLRDRIPGILGRRGTVFFNANASISVLGLRFGDAAFTSIPMNDTVTRSVLPQFVFGGGWYSAAYFTNSTSSAVNLPVRFFTNGGAPMTVNGSSSQTLAIPAGGTAVIQAANTGPLSEGWLSWAPTPGITGYGVFRQTVAGRPDQEAVVLFANGVTSGSTILTFDETQGLVTAAAVANAGTSNGNVTLTAFDNNGVSLGTATIGLNAQNKTSITIRQLIPAVVGRQGFIRFQLGAGSPAGSSIAVLGLRFGGSAFTSIPSATGN